MALASRAAALAFALLLALMSGGCGDDDSDDGTGTDTGDLPDLPDTDFEIQLVYQTDATDTQRDAFENARRRWGAVIRNSLGSARIDLASPEAIETCDSTGAGGEVTTSGVAIIVQLADIDGRGGTLGAAGPCFVRQATGSPVLGIMIFDTADLELLELTDRLETVILHEMGHVIGFGTLWGLEGLLANPSLPQNRGADTHFTGAGARAAFDDASAAPFDGSIVPVDNTAQPGSADGHWREDVFDNELMTPSISGTELSVPMSAITIASLADFEFYEVNADLAEPYAVPVLLAAAPDDGPAPPHADDVTVDDGDAVEFDCDLVRPSHAVDARGGLHPMQQR